MSLPPGTRFGRYELVARVGSGAMGDVYRARDTRLGRDVAIKTLAARLVHDASAHGRFEREARAIAALSHVNILAIHDFGHADGVPYVVMELLDGVTLRARLATGRLPLLTALDYARQLARGLAAAHAGGVIHRDLKPANVFLSTSGAIKILDFGLATIVAPPTPDGSDVGQDETRAAFETQPGAMVGTPAYMPPEQIRGGHVDERADIFAFGALLYEMLAGASPFAANSPADAMSNILTVNPPRLEATSPLATALEHIARRCFEKRAEDRFQSAVDLLAALVALDDTTVPVGPARPLAIAPPTPYSSIAVLPLTDVSADQQLAYLCDGLAEEVANGLTKVPGLRVAARTSTLQFKGKTDDVRRIGRQLQVDAVLTGSVRSAGTRLRVAMQLVGVADGYHLWSERFDCTLDDAFAVEDQVSRGVIAALQMQLAGAPSTLLARPGDPEAHTLYLKGRHYWNRRTEESLAKSIELFQEAIARDPNYAPAYGALADAYGTLGVYGAAPPRDVMPKARAAAEHALTMAGTPPGVVAMLGCISAVYDWDWAAAARRFQHALEVDAQYPNTHQLHAMTYLVPLGRFDEAAATLTRALELDPLSLPINASVGFSHYYARRYDQAVAETRRTLELDAHFAMARWILGQALTELGRHDEAIAEFERAEQQSGRSPEVIAALGHAHGRAGRADRAESTLGRLADLAAMRYVSPALFAVVEASLGRVDAALDSLDRALEVRAADLAWIGVRPTVDALRGHPRFAAICRDVGVAPSARAAL